MPGASEDLSFEEKFNLWEPLLFKKGSGMVLITHQLLGFN